MLVGLRTVEWRKEIIIRLSYRRYALRAGFTRDLAIYEVYSIIQSVGFLTPLASPDNVHGVTQSAKQVDAEIVSARYIGNRKARE